VTQDGNREQTRHLQLAVSSWQFRETWRLLTADCKLVRGERVRQERTSAGSDAGG
jgi:hypothetical protein